MSMSLLLFEFLFSCNKICFFFSISHLIIMMKCGADPKVKKTLVRNSEQTIRPTTRNKFVHDVGDSSATSAKQSDHELNQPTLCSSELLANYLSGVKKSLPPPLSADDLRAGKTEICAKMTKKLNFHFNDRIYKNLIELNASAGDLKTRKEKRPQSASSSAKRDVEPNIEDFYEEDIEFDVAPDIPVLKPKFKPVWRVEDGELHRLVSAFESL